MMSDANNISIEQVQKQAEFYDSSFQDLDFSQTELDHKIFENCRFKHCNFNEAKFNSCKFINCEFSACDLNCIEINNTSFSEVTFAESKITGVNWTQARWPSIALDSPIQFYQCNISHCSFYELDLSGIIIEQCKAHGVDFRETNLSHARLVLTDLDCSLFLHTNLRSADFTEAINYVINPLENTIKQAKFSSPEVLNLLLGFDIEIQ